MKSGEATIVNAHTQSKKPRDPRLDFYRGLAMFIIFTAHVPWNAWTLYIPARFGFSDATEIFVFCSGMASALAFGKVFDQHGFGVGTARILYRAWQVYWGHIAQFMVIAGGLALIMNSGILERCCDLTENYVESLNLGHIFDNTRIALPALMTLSWVPNYFDILPMYLVILCLIPVTLLVARASVPAAFALSAGMWLATQFGYLALPAEPWSDRTWFFNPFAWQLVFFTGFAFMRGWIPAPPVKPWLIALALAIVIASIPFAFFRIHQNIAWITEVRELIRPLWIKTEFGLFRYIHFLAVAYLAWVAAGENGHRLLHHGRVWGDFVRVVQTVGQQSLAVFLASMVLAQVAGILRDTVWGRGSLLPEFLANVLGYLAIIAVAYSVTWFKNQPWRKPPATGVSRDAFGPAQRGSTPASTPARNRTESEPVS